MPTDTQQPFTDDELRILKQMCEVADWPIGGKALLPLIVRLEAAERVAAGAEMAWVVMANVSGGNWKDQPQDWQEAAARWRDAWHKDFDAWRKSKG